MTKSIFAILIAVVLVLAIVVGVISAVNVPGEGSGNIFDDIFGEGAVVTDSNGSVVTDSNGSAVTDSNGSIINPSDDNFLNQVKLFDSGQWYSIDYTVEYEPEVSTSGQVAGYLVYVKVKLSPNSLYNIAFDFSSNNSQLHRDRGCRYYDPVNQKWKIASDGSFVGSVSDVYTDNSGWLKFDLYYNYAAQNFTTSEEAIEFARALSQKDFSLLITPRQTQVQYRASGVTSTIPYNVICLNEHAMFPDLVTYIPCIELKLDPGKKYSFEYDFSNVIDDGLRDQSVYFYDFEKSSWELIEFNEDRKGTFSCNADSKGVIRIIPTLGEANTYVDTYDDFVEYSDLLKKTDFSVKITPIS